MIQSKNALITISQTQNADVFLICFVKKYLKKNCLKLSTIHHISLNSILPSIISYLEYFPPFFQNIVIIRTIAEPSNKPPN